MRWKSGGTCPGTKLRFRSYDPLGFGWYTLGQLTVSPDGRQLAAAPRATLGEVGCGWTWIVDTSTALFATLGSYLGLGEPVNASTGVFLSAKTDLVVPDVIPIVLRHVYRSDDNDVSNHGVFGIATRHDYQMDLHGDGQAYTYADVYLADGRKIHYTRISPGTGYTDAVMEHTATPSRWYKSQLYYVAAQGWEIKLTDGTRYQYEFVYHTAPKLHAIIDRLGNTLTITRWPGVGGGAIDRITTPNGRYVEFTNDPNQGYVETLAAGWRCWWRLGETERLRAMALRVLAGLINSDRRLALYACATGALQGR